MARGIIAPVISLLLLLLTLAVIAVVVAVATGMIRGGLDEPATTVAPRGLPADRVTGRDVAGLRFVQAFRGYRMDQVDATLDQLALEVDRLRAEVVRERSARLQLARGGPGGSDLHDPQDGDPGLGTDPAAVDLSVTPADPADPPTRPLRRPRRRAAGDPLTGELPQPPSEGRP